MNEEALGREQARLLRRAMDHAGLDLREVWMHFFSIGGDVGELEVEAYLHHSLILPGIQRDILAHAVNEIIDHGPVLHAPYTYDLTDRGQVTGCSAQHETDDGDTSGQ